MRRRRRSKRRRNVSARARSICVTPGLVITCSAMLLSRLDGPVKLLVRALMCGASGASRALSVFRRQHRANPDVSLCGFIQTLCEDAVACDAGPLTVKPLVCLFPALFKQNLLSFIHLASPLLPQASVLHLLKCLSHDPHPNPWVTSLSRQLERSLGLFHEEPLYSSQCGERLQELSQRLRGFGASGGWTCFTEHTVESTAQGASGLLELSTQRKRKGDFDLDPDGEEMGQQSKRVKVEVCGGEPVEAEESGAREKEPELFEKNVCRSPAEELQPPIASTCDDLPEHIKVSVLHIKELLESQTEWEQSSTDMFKVLNDCDPAQVDLLCSTLRFSELPEHTLPILCSGVLALTPDLSFSTAATVIRSLLLEKVRSLSESASRCLVSTASSLCSRYPRPMCHALIGPVIEDVNIGNAQVELLKRLIEDCLDSYYRLLVFQMTLRVKWSEAMLSIIHSLLDSKPDLNEELFTQFIEHLASQGSQFTKSMKFAKMMLTVLTKYTSNVNTAHKHTLNGCLVLNETFLKKSLQSALKRVTNK
ncbi:Fanconi anemia group E protein [Betta splendens]|uniref:Fanconi anemia group E protein n=1 Tax=Betta splendens TaxID=158456 RepID=A0A6P7N4J6_BETSP|nr:Fanconi anemia group E protein [Betta splendens]